MRAKGNIMALKVLMVRLAWLLLSVAALSLAVEPIEFARDIEPIFQERCYACHGEAQQLGQLRLDSRSVGDC